jgi:hypothetical protein
MNSTSTFLFSLSFHLDRAIHITFWGAPAPVVIRGVNQCGSAPASERERRGKGENGTRNSRLTLNDALWLSEDRLLPLEPIDPVIVNIITPLIAVDAPNPTLPNPRLQRLFQPLDRPKVGLQSRRHHEIVVCQRFGRVGRSGGAVRIGGRVGGGTGGKGVCRGGEGGSVRLMVRDGGGGDQRGKSATHFRFGGEAGSDKGPPGLIVVVVGSLQKEE